MSAAPSDIVFAFEPWWRELLRQDAEYMQAWQCDRDDGTGLPDHNPLLACVFCARSLEADIRRDATRGRHLGHMLAYWGPQPRPGNPDDLASPPHGTLRIIAAGLYCHGRVRRGCLAQAERVGLLLDTHTPYVTGRNAMAQLELRLAGNTQWEPAALRRFVLIHVQLGRLPTLREEPRK